MGETRSTAAGDTNGQAPAGADLALVGATLMFEILCLLAEATAKRRAR